MNDETVSSPSNRENAVQRAVRATLGPEGRMLALSKENYAARNPTHVVVFNGNVLVAGVKRWHGDIDVSRDESLLVELARRTDETVSVLFERDARFATEAQPLIERAVYTAMPDGSPRFSESQMMRRSDGRLVWRQGSS